MWSYDGSRFADNMSVICQPTTELEADRYTIGAFVGDECRGEGRMINGRFFVTVYGEMGEKVSFRLYDALTGEYFVLDDAVDFASTVGTYQRPMALNTPGRKPRCAARLSESLPRRQTTQRHSLQQRYRPGSPRLR